MDAKKVETGSGDAISSLPDEILCKILALLPTKLAAATSLLSKRWRTLNPLMNHLFASQHHFYLDDSELLYPGEQDGKRRDIRESFKSLRDIRESFKSFVDKTLSNCKSMKKLSLKCRHDRLSLDLIDQWIQKAFEQGLVDLDLYLETTTVISQGSLVHFGQIAHLPSTFFINKSLVSLILGINFGTVATLFPKKVSLPVLKSLILNGVWSGIELLCHLMLPGCPVLEELSLHYLDGYPLTRPRFGALSIVHTTLKRVTLDYNNMIDYSNLAFNTPSLVYLDYSGIAPSSHPTVNYCFLDSLVEAKLDVLHVGNNPSTKLSMIINWMRNVKTLSLTCASVKTMSSHLKEELPLFVNLVKLSFESDTEQGWEVLPRMLNKSPKLETLVLKGLHCVRKEGVCIDQKEVKVLEIHAFSGKSREFRQLKSFLCQMQFLQEMRVKIKADDYKTLQLISRLLDLPERSSKCEIHFL